MTQLSANLLTYQQLLIKVSRLINVVNSRGIFSKEEIASEYSNILTEVREQIGAPLTQYYPFIKGEPPISSKVNLFFDGCSTDLNAIASQVDFLNAKSISIFNLFSTEIENEKRFSERIASKSKILQMYSRSPADDIYYVGDSFDNDDLIDYSKIQAGLNPLIKNGIMSLSVSAAQKWNANVVKVLSSGGFIGNSHQVIKATDSEESSEYQYIFERSSALNNLTSLKDSNPLTYFEYEALNVDKSKPTPQPSIPARENEFKYIKSEFSSSNTGEGDLVDWSTHNTADPLVLDLELASSNSPVANSIDITPYFGSMKYVEVTSIVVYGKDGVSHEALDAPIYIGSSLVPLNLQMAKSYFYSKATVRFAERRVFKVQVSFKQQEYSNMEMQHVYWKPTSSNTNNPFANLERFNPDALNKDIYEKVEYNRYNLLPTISNPTEYSKLGKASKSIEVFIKKKPVARKFYVIELSITNPSNEQVKAYFEGWFSENSPDRDANGNFIAIRVPRFLDSIDVTEDEIRNKNYDTIDAAQKDFDELIDLYMSRTMLAPVGTTFTASGTTTTTANALLTGKSYTIAFVGTTNFTLLGAASNAVGVVFTKNSTTGTGTGTASWTGTFTGLTQSATSGSGTGAVFSITKTGTGVTYSTTSGSANITVTMTKYGTGYAVGDTIKILGTSLGGTTPANDLTLTVATIGPTLLDDGSTVNRITVIEQSFTAQERITKYSIPLETAKERYPAKRWCIGLRDIEVYKETFNSQLEIVSLPFSFDFPVESVMLDINSNIDEEMLKNVSILGYISVDNGSNWIQISPIQLDFSGVPEVLFFNQSVLNEYRLSGGSYLSYPTIPKEVKNILVKIKIVKKNRINFTPSIYSYQLIAKVKRS